MTFLKTVQTSSTPASFYLSTSHRRWLLCFEGHLGGALKTLEFLDEVGRAESEARAEHYARRPREAREPSDGFSLCYNFK